MSIYAGQIQTAMAGAIDTEKLAEAWAALHPGTVGKDLAAGAGADNHLWPQTVSPPPAEVRGERAPAAKALSPVLSQFLARAATAITRALAGILPNAWTEGWVLGQASAHALVGGGQVDWGNWKPGDHRAAAAIAGPGLAQLLAERDIRIKSIAQSRLQDLADVLEATLASDVVHRPPLPAPLPPTLSVGDLARQLKTVLSRPDRAQLVATTEIARAQAEASRTVYRETGRTEVEISTAEDDKVCPVCDAAQAEGAHPIGQPPMVPIHPRCRCAELPVLVTA